MRLVKFKKLFLSSLFLSLPFNSAAIFAEELFRQDHNPVLIAETNRDYREHEHEDESRDEDDIHSINHDWTNHYHTIRSVTLKSNGNLKIKFCEKMDKESLEGYVYADDIKYDVEDAYKKNKRSIVWRLNKKGTFEKGNSVFIDTKDFLGRPTEKEPNPNEIRSLERGCGLPFLYLPPGVEVTGESSALPIIGLVIAIGAAAAGGGGSSGGTGAPSSN